MEEEWKIHRSGLGRSIEVGSFVGAIGWEPRKGERRCGKTETVVIPHECRVGVGLDHWILADISTSAFISCVE